MRRLHTRRFLFWPELWGGGAVRRGLHVAWSHVPGNADGVFADQFQGVESADRVHGAGGHVPIGIINPTAKCISQVNCEPLDEVNKECTDVVWESWEPCDGAPTSPSGTPIGNHG